MLSGFRPFLPYTFLLFFIPIHAQFDTKEHAFVTYRMLLNEVEGFIEWDHFEANNFNDFQTKILALEELTGLMSNDDGSCWTGYTRIPISYNLEDWTQWHQLNKHQLVMNKETGVLETIGQAIPIVREPNTYFLSLVNDMELMILNDTFNWDLSMWFVGILDPLTQYRTTHHLTECSCDTTEDTFPLGTLHHIAILREWYAQNSHKLYWDLESQLLAVRPEN